MDRRNSGGPRFYRKRNSAAYLSTDESGPTETIDLNALFSFEANESGSFDLSKVTHSTFAELLQALSVPTLLIARSHAIKFANSAFVRTTHDSFDLTGATFSSLFPNPREARQAQLLLEKVFTERKAEIRERVLQIRKVRLWARIHLRTIRLGDEQLVLVQIENLTAQKQLLSVQKYKKLMKIFPIGISEFALPRQLDLSLTADKLLSSVLDARIVDGNEKFANIYQRGTISDLTGTRLSTLLPFKGRGEILYKQWAHAGFPIRSFETREADASGAVHFFENTLIGNVNSQRLLGFWWLKRDVTEKKKAEEEFAKSQRIESLGILAGGIAHDFNNLLTAMLGNVSLAQTYLTPDHKAYDRLEAAATASKRAQALTYQLLTFSKGGAPIKKTASVAELLKDTVRFALRGSNIHHELSIPDSLLPVEIDEGQISQVVHNLIINALQAMPDGGTIVVQAENCVVRPEYLIPISPGNYVRIRIKDAGVGIPPGILQKIFDPYFSTKEGGSGLGLSTAYSIIKKHDGLITVNSEVGLGSTFYIYLPASKGHSAATGSEAIEEEDPSYRGKILVMDDEECIRELVRELLAHIGYAVCLVNGGDEAVAEYQRAKDVGKPFDAVIMDLTVPGGMGGREAIQRLRKIDPDVLAIVSSGYSDDPVLADFKAHGFAGVLSKPYTSDDVINLLQSVMESTRDPAGKGCRLKD
ncbi:MAG: ATP-binding protein [Desulfomonilaceae bacterium]